MPALHLLSLTPDFSHGCGIQLHEDIVLCDTNVINTSSASALHSEFLPTTAQDTEDHTVCMHLQPRNSGALATCCGTINQGGRNWWINTPLWRIILWGTYSLGTQLQSLTRMTHTIWAHSSCICAWQERVLGFYWELGWWHFCETRRAGKTPHKEN